VTHIWVRQETRENEGRVPLVPADAAFLVRAGCQVTVERSAHRVFPIEDYLSAGCQAAPPGGWADAPADACVLGLKELPPTPAALRHRHIYFGHAYKGQRGAAELMHRFRAGGGLLLDLEYLTDERGRRLAAFGYWAGYAGTAIAILALRGIQRPLRPCRRAELDAALPAPGPAPRVLVIGALGRCGRGARDACATAGIRPTPWDLAETRRLDKAALLGHDLLVNTVLATHPIPPFVEDADLVNPDRALRLICDVSCDVTSPCHTLPVYDRVTTWDEPFRPLAATGRPLRVMAIDNLPALLPREASEAFSAELRTHLLDLTSPPWRHAAERFHTTIEEYEDA
jgi:saccharopine dehydrogenase (NAD+, L-lysine forming)